jgi:hypothetical protein
MAGAVVQLRLQKFRACLCTGKHTLLRETLLFPGTGMSSRCFPAAPLQRGQLPRTVAGAGCADQCARKTRETWSEQVTARPQMPRRLSPDTVQMSLQANARAPRSVFCPPVQCVVGSSRISRNKKIARMIFPHTSPCGMRAHMHVTSLTSTRAFIQHSTPVLRFYRIGHSEGGTARATHAHAHLSAHDANAPTRNPQRPPQQENDASAVATGCPARTGRPRARHRRGRALRHLLAAAGRARWHVLLKYEEQAPRAHGGATPCPHRPRVHIPFSVRRRTRRASEARRGR